MAVRSFTDGEGAQWTVWAVRPETRERRRGEERRSGRDRRDEAAGHLDAVAAERRALSDRRATRERRLTPRSRAVIVPSLEHGWLCFEAGLERRRLAPIPPDWEGCDLATLAAYHRRATISRPSSRSA